MIAHTQHAQELIYHVYSSLGLPHFIFVYSLYHGIPRINCQVVALDLLKIILLKTILYLHIEVNFPQHLVEKSYKKK